MILEEGRISFIHEETYSYLQKDNAANWFFYAVDAVFLCYSMFQGKFTLRLYSAIVSRHKSIFLHDLVYKYKNIYFFTNPSN